GRRRAGWCELSRAGSGTCDRRCRSPRPASLPDGPPRSLTPPIREGETAGSRPVRPPHPLRSRKALASALQKVPHRPAAWSPPAMKRQAQPAKQQETRLRAQSRSSTPYSVRLRRESSIRPSEDQPEAWLDGRFPYPIIAVNASLPAHPACEEYTASAANTTRSLTQIHDLED